MANGNSYDYQLTNPEGTLVKDSGSLTFTDSAVQPFAPGVLGAVQVKGPFAIAFDTASLNAGVAIGYTPAIGDLFQIIVVVSTAFDGTTPLLDVGFTGDTNGFFYEASGAKTAMSVASPLSLTAFDVSGSVTLDGTTPVVSTPAWAKATAADALLVWVSQDGTKGGTAIGGTTGAASLYVLAATPTAF